MNGKAKAALKRVSINRDASGKPQRFLDVFVGFDDVTAIKKIFGKKTDGLLDNLQVKISDKPWFMWIDDKKGRVMIGKRYLRNGDKLHLYLDAVHELVHIRQWYEGKELWDKRYDYVDRPTEIEAYKTCVAEAKRLGLTKKEIASYLYMKWLTNEQFKRLLKASGA